MPNPDDLADDAALAEFSNLLQALLDWRKTIDLQIDGRTIMRTTVDFVTLRQPGSSPELVFVDGFYDEPGDPGFSPAPNGGTQPFNPQATVSDWRTDMLPDTADGSPALPLYPTGSNGFSAASSLFGSDTRWADVPSAGAGPGQPSAGRATSPPPPEIAGSGEDEDRVDWPIWYSWDTASWNPDAWREGMPVVDAILAIAATADKARPPEPPTRRLDQQEAPSEPEPEPPPAAPHDPSQSAPTPPGDLDQPPAQAAAPSDPADRPPAPETGSTWEKIESWAGQLAEETKRNLATLLPPIGPVDPDDWGKQGALAVGISGGIVAGTACAVPAAALGAAGGSVVPGPGTVLGGAAGVAAGIAECGPEGVVIGAAGGSAIGYGTAVVINSVMQSSAPDQPPKKQSETTEPPGTPKTGPEGRFTSEDAVIPDDPFPTPTRPRGPDSGWLRGEPETLEQGVKPEKKAGIRAQNETLRRAAQQGYEVTSQPTKTLGSDGKPLLTREQQKALGLNPGKIPDALINGRVFDVYAPTTGSVRNVYESIAEKVGEDQAHRVIVNLDGTTVTPSQLRKYLLENPIDRLKEIKVVYQGKISTLFPFRN
jgi:hypothetical protein